MKYALVLASVLSFTMFANATPQQEKMKTCNAQATGKKGQERKDFMKSCLSADSATTAAAPAPTTQQQKMKDCNAQAAGKKGEERKSFMSTCLKGETATH